MIVERETLCIIGNAKSPKSDPITHRFVHFFITFIADAETGEIIDLEVSTALQLTNIFIRGLFIGQSLAAVDEALLEKVRTHYLGTSQRAIQVAYKDAVRKYRAWRNNVIITE
ncbi:DUF3870 domain-containing protein [Cloacibacillus sp.]|uniref:DUF3870 domain-containing protein n=1 Tax=Cloacibacillus sp. TaxID=2049023 RepID=UPI0025C0C201|nr:DUF3870 domain-containing protein [Cloacibacillus sp.]